MPMPKEESREAPSGHYVCWFCQRPIEADNPDAYVQVISWVHGPKSDGPVLRERTGQKAHGACVKKIQEGQSIDQEPLL